MSDHERRFIGAILQDNEILYQTSITPEQLRLPRHRLVYEAITRIVGEGGHADLLAVSDALPNMPPAQIAELTDNVVVGAWRQYQSAIVAESRIGVLRRVSERFAKTTATTLDEDISYAREELDGIDASDESLKAIQDLVTPMIDEIERRYKLKGEIPGITTGLLTLDEILGGWQPQRLYYIGARPSQGKSAFAHNFIVHAVRAGHRVGLVTLESGSMEVMLRLFSNTSGINSAKINKGRLTAASFSAMQDVAGEMHDKWRLWIAEGHQGTLTEVQARARQMVRAHGCEVVLVDYLQMIAQTDGRQTMREHIVKCSKAMKGLALELGVPVVVLAQLRRDADNRRPVMSDFGESSQIEMDADVAMLIHHDEKDESWLIVDKHRDGPRADVAVYFNRERMRIHERAPYE
jgi:replicative DNA helicase